MWSITNLYHGKHIIANIANISCRSYAIAMKYVGTSFLYQKLTTKHSGKEKLSMSFINQLAENERKQ